MSRIYVLGAGFSKPAGFPLGNELFREILMKAKNINGNNLYKNILKRDIDEYIQYMKSVKNIDVAEEEINFEDFISFLDIEHFLGLRGGDTWSEEGNRSQILVKNLISYILYERLQLLDETALNLYLDFAAKLKPSDYIITFNYDTLLETCLEKLKKPFRLFPRRFSEIDNYGSGVSDTRGNEVVILKMHGSIDWFDISRYDNAYQYAKNNPWFFQNKHLIFNNCSTFSPYKLVDGPYPKDSPLTNIYRVSNLGEYFNNTSFVSESPLIISPSYGKIVYLNPLREFWHDFNNVGILNEKVIVIGFSLSSADDYSKLPIFRLINNFQNIYNPGFEEILKFKKSKLAIIDSRKSDEDISEYRKNYSFVNWENTDVDFDGFRKTSLDTIFNDV